MGMTAAAPLERDLLDRLEVLVDQGLSISEACRRAGVCRQEVYQEAQEVPRGRAWQILQRAEQLRGAPPPRGNLPAAGRIVAVDAAADVAAVAIWDAVTEEVRVLVVRRRERDPLVWVHEVVRSQLRRGDLLVFERPDFAGGRVGPGGLQRAERCGALRLAAHAKGAAHLTSDESAMREGLTGQARARIQTVAAKAAVELGEEVPERGAGAFCWLAWAHLVVRTGVAEWSRGGR